MIPCYCYTKGGKDIWLIENTAMRRIFGNNNWRKGLNYRLYQAK
jgi:hypothetical protein